MAAMFNFKNILSYHIKRHSPYLDYVFQSFILNVQLPVLPRISQPQYKWLQPHQSIRMSLLIAPFPIKMHSFVCIYNEFENHSHYYLINFMLIRQDILSSYPFYMVRCRKVGKRMR